ncbi:MAG: hypothetical protein ABFS56_12945 [Pseudomonadota bacterium]
MHYLLVFIGVIAYLGTKLYDDLKIEVSSDSNGTTEELKSSHEDDEHNQYLANVGRTVQRRYAIASASLVLAALGSLFFPVLIFISVAGIVYTTIPIWKNGYRSLFKEHRFDMAVFDSLLFPWLFIARHYFLLALLNWICCLSKTFAHQVKYIEKNLRATLVQVFGKIPKFVWLLKDGVEIEVPCEELNVGDTIVVNANEIIPVDGVIVNGTTLIDQRILTGEFQPLQKTAGDQVFAATIVLSDRIFIRVGKSSSETLVAQLVGQRTL